MTFQELKGKILFWVVVVLIVGALLSGNLGTVVYLIGLLMVGVVAYQIIGWAIYGITGGNLDPFNIKKKGLFPKSKSSKNNKKYE